MDKRHTLQVERISTQVQDFYAKDIPFRVYHGSTNSTRQQTFDRRKMVDVSELNRVLHIDTTNKTAIVEPNVAMDGLVEATMVHDLVPPVVMEFPGITVGGGIQGGAGESSSYKWGTFNRIVKWYEIVLGNGKVLRVSPTEYGDLYWGAAGSYGSLGVITAAEIQLVPAKQYVEVTYTPVSNFDMAMQHMKKTMAKRPDFVDGILFSKTSGVIVKGVLQDHATAPVRYFSQAHDEWFYLHAEKFALAGKEVCECLPLVEYLFRYDRGAFWMGKHAFTLFKFPFNRFMRWMLDSLFTTRRLYTALQASGAAQQYIIQDLAVPEKTAVRFMKYIDSRFNIYPLWLCPLLSDTKSPLLSSYLKTSFVMNVGVWGKFGGNYDQFVQANQELELTVQKLGGKKWLYAHTYYDEKQFWKIYGGKKHYDALRKKYHAQKLPSVYEKIRVREEVKVQPKRGILFAVFGINGIRVQN